VTQDQCVAQWGGTGPKTSLREDQGGETNTNMSSRDKPACDFVFAFVNSIWNQKVVDSDK
jgi:hypothetical protein